MATIGRANLPIPDGADAPVGPGAFADLAAALDPRVIHHVTNQAQRDTDFADAPQRTVVVAANGTTWVKTSGTANTWATLYEPVPAWKTLTLWAGLMTYGGYTPQYRVYQGRVWMRGRVQRADGNQWVGDGPTIAATPPEAVPARLGVWAGTHSLTGDPAIGTCRIESGTSIVWYSQDGSGAYWVDISGSYWLD